MNVKQQSINNGKWILIQNDKEFTNNLCFPINNCSSITQIPSQANNLEIIGVNLKNAWYKHIGRQFILIKSALCLQRGFWCYLARKKWINIIKEKSALVI